MSYVHHQLPNGLQIVHSQVVNTEIAHCGIMLDIGSRDESRNDQGIAHFWEHMAFKGTRKRKAYHILNRLESLGGEINAFTDKEKILFYVSIRDIHLEKTIELLTDITFSSIFPKIEIERERSVILEEMAMCSDDPEDLLHDKFDNTIFSNHPLGRNILGTKETVESFQQEDFKKFITTHLDTRKIVFSCVSSVPENTVLRLAEKYMAALPRCTAVYKRKKFTNYTPKEVFLKKGIQQLKYAMGRPAYLLKDDRRRAFSMLVNVLGGSGMNSRLNWILREKNGYVYSIGSYYVPFTDTGLFMISFGTEPARLTKSLKLITGELRRLCENPLGIKQMNTVREQALMRLTMAKENHLHMMITAARNLLDLGRLPNSEKTREEIHETSPLRLLELANEMFDINQFCALRIEPQ